MFTERALADGMFREGLSLHLFAEMEFLDKIYTCSHMIMMMMQD